MANAQLLRQLEDSFTGYTAELSVDTAKSAVTQIVIRTANYTLTMTPA